jgi:hypothetical protein
MVTARMAGFNPGTSPPPVRIPITPFFVFMIATLRSKMMFEDVLFFELTPDRLPAAVSNAIESVRLTP